MKKLLGGVALMIVCALVGSVLGVIGAGLSGLPTGSSGSWDLRPLLYAFWGFLAGSLGFLLLVGLLPSSLPGRMFMAAAGAMTLSFLTGIFGYPIAQHDAKMNRQKDKNRAAESDSRYKDFYATLRSDPDIVVRDQWYRARDERHDVYKNPSENGM